jgi:hypothetical protein
MALGEDHWSKSEGPNQFGEIQARVGLVAAPPIR